MGIRGRGVLPKHEREQLRAQRRAGKLQRKKLRGVELRDIPQQWQGVAKTLLNGEDPADGQ